MRSLLNFLSITFFALLFFTSCQDEVFEETPINADDQEILVASSTLAAAMQATATMDGSFDNIIDNANCLSIELPVTVVVNGLEIIVDSIEDYEVIEAIFDEFDDDDDSLEIVFPITIILSDFTEININSFDELQDFVGECNGENQEDDDIECIDFQYPITISIFNSEFQVIDTITIESDEELHNFIENELDDNVLASLNYPVTMILLDGTTITVNSNAELEAAIEAAENECDEDDDNDFSDDDEVISPSQFEEIFTSCTWTVDKLELGDQNLEDQYVGYVFTFNGDGSVSVDTNGATLSGTWDKIITDNGIQINLQINDLPDFNNEHWILHEVQDFDGGVKIDFRNGEDRLRFESFECEENNNPTTCTELEVDNILMECYWVAAAITGSDDFSEYAFEFKDGQQLIVEGNGMSVSGNWITSGSENGVVITISELTETLQIFNGEWLVVECGGERLVLSNGETELVIERSCESDVTPTDLFNVVTEGQWVVANYNDSGVNETENFSNWILTFNVDGSVIAENDNTIEGTWSGIIDNGQLKMVLDFGEQSPFNEFNDDWDVIDLQTARIELKDISGGDGTIDVLVFERL